MKIEEGLTFDDILLQPAYSECLPSDCDTSTYLTQDIQIKIPLISAAMDTVTEAETAISIAQEGGIGIIHKNMSIERQAIEVEKVKRSENGIITKPVTTTPDQPLREVTKLVDKFRISGFPVVRGKELIGIITNRDIRFAKDDSLPVSEVMTHGREKLVVVRPGISLDEAKEIMHKHRIEKLLQVNENYELQGLITIKDINKAIQYPNSVKDSLGRLRVGAAIGVEKGVEERLNALVNMDVDVIVLDTAHGHSKNVIKTLRQIKEMYPNLQVIAGNVATGEGTKMLIENGADAVKVGIGPGSICTTRIISGIGVPQITAIKNCAEVAEKKGIPIISDGGIRFSGEIVKAIAVGARSVMLGSIFAGTDEAPGEVILYRGRRYKLYRGMGSISAMKDGSSDRYFQQEMDVSKFVPEGIEGQVPYKGPMAETIWQLIGGLRSGMGYTGNRTIPELIKNTRYVRASLASLRESHVHDVMITKESPNYINENAL